MHLHPLMADFCRVPFFSAPSKELSHRPTLHTTHLDRRCLHKGQTCAKTQPFSVFNVDGSVITTFTYKLSAVQINLLLEARRKHGLQDTRLVNVQTRQCHPSLSVFPGIPYFSAMPGAYGSCLRIKQSIEINKLLKHLPSFVSRLLKNSS